jgi:hypothetical protein
LSAASIFIKLFLPRPIKELPAVALSALEKIQFYFKWLFTAITAKKSKLKQKK